MKLRITLNEKIKDVECVKKEDGKRREV